MMYDDIKLEIYENEAKGLISQQEKDILLSHLEETYDFSEFCEYHGLIPVDSDNVVFESIRSRIGSFMRKRFDMKAIKNQWTRLSQRFSHRWKAKIISPKEKKKTYGII